MKDNFYPLLEDFIKQQGELGGKNSLSHPNNESEDSQGGRDNGKRQKEASGKDSEHNGSTEHQGRAERLAGCVT